MIRIMIGTARSERRWPQRPKPAFWLLGLILTCCVGLHGATRTENTEAMVLRDRWGRDLRTAGVTLVDWEGHIANPAVELLLDLGERVNLPARVVLTANGCRLMFNLFSEVGPSGPTRVLLYESHERSARFRMAVVPDRAGGDEDYTLTARLTTGVGEERTAQWRVRVLDQDRPEPPAAFVHVDYSQDETGFFRDARARRIFEQAVGDWTYFLADQGFEPVEAGRETAFINEPTTFERGHTVQNASAYTGYLLYAQGIQVPERRSGGRASDTGGLQRRDGRALGLRRSGTVLSEITGNWNGLGWSMEEDDDRWWVSSCSAGEPHDYYSVVRHEIGHTLLYHRVHPAFARLMRNGRIHADAVRAYLGQEPRVNASEHLFETVDPISRVGAFGNEYGGDMPRKRWLLTKVDLLMLQAVGYRLRPTTSLAPLEIEAPRICRGSVGERLSCPIKIAGGIPPYRVRVSRGALPEGVELNDRTGELTGIPSREGRYAIGLEVEDGDPRRPARRAALRLIIDRP